MALMLAMNLVLWYTGSITPNFRYGSTTFPFSMLVYGGFQMAFLLIIGLCSNLFGAEFKNRTIINSIAYGCSREMLFFGKLIVTLICCALTLVLVEGTLIGSAYLLLEDGGIEALKSLMRATIACLPGYICGACAAVAFFYTFGSDLKGIWAWLIVFIGVPSVTSILGLKFETIATMDKWLVYNLFGETAPAPAYGMIWDTAEGFRRCILAGVMGIIVFIIVGIIGVRKKEVH